MSSDKEYKTENQKPDPDANFLREIMEDSVTGNDWFGGLTPAEARKEDLAYINAHKLEVDGTFRRIGENMNFFTDIVADLERGVRVWENKNYHIERDLGSKGLQECPWQDDAWSSDTEAVVTNKETGVKTVVNYGTAHLAEKHHILEKGENNTYATSVESFLKNFDQLPEYFFTKTRLSEQGEK